MLENVWARVVFMAVALGAWFWTQGWIGRRTHLKGTIGDRVHEWTARWHQQLQDSPRAANAALIASSLLIDLLGLFIIIYSVFGPDIRPFISLLVIFSLRQLCQATTALPPPPGMIWRDPGFPSFLVTYGVSNDLFFSGHTAIAVLGVLVVASLGISWLTALALIIAAFEIVIVLILRAHYTLDVFTGAIVALWIWSISRSVSF